MSLKRLIINFGEVEFKYTQIVSIDILIIHSNKRPVALIALPFIFNVLVTETLPKVKLESNNAKNYSSSIWEVISSHYYTKFI